MRIRMFRTTAEAKGEDLDPVNMIKTPPPQKSIADRSKAVLLLWSLLRDNLNNVLFQN